MVLEITTLRITAPVRSYHQRLSQYEPIGSQSLSVVACCMPRRPLDTDLFTTIVFRAAILLMPRQQLSKFKWGMQLLKTGIEEWRLWLVLKIIIRILREGVR
jgi:hypothetical protein